MGTVEETMIWIKLLKLEKELQNKELKFWLLSIFSDFYPDPGIQKPPKAWKDLNFEQKNKKLKNLLLNQLQDLKISKQIRNCCFR